MAHHASLLLAVLVSCPSLLPAADSGPDPSFIWIEGEQAQTQNMLRHGWYDSVNKSALSGQEWLSHFQPGPAPEAIFRFKAPETATYHFWIRCNPAASPRLSYLLNDGAWTEPGLNQPVGRSNIASDGKPDMRFVAWVNAGTVPLSVGPQTIRFRFHSDNNNHGGLDCFVFSRLPFRPRGFLKPGERSGLANPGFFAWEPDTDTFDDSALVDLRFLNEPLAGQSGRVRAKGNNFILGDGTSVKFWAANAGPGIWALDHESHIYLARRLAKTGVNMVRLHGSLYNSTHPDIDPRKLDTLHHFVHALRQEGIYVALSFYFPLWFQLETGQNSFMLLFFDPEMQRIYNEWADRLLNTLNPYTHLPLGKDPAIALVEIVNEDSHFFWTFGKRNMSTTRWEQFQQVYGSWLRNKYGSFDAMFRAWNGVRESGDDPDRGRIELYDAWTMTSQGIAANVAKKSRISDQVRFLSGNMRNFYEQTIRLFRDQCGYEGLVSCGNWHVTDPGQLDALERHGYTAGDVIDHHGYFDHGHKGDAASYSVRPGHQFTSQSALHLRQSNPLPFVDTDGYPHITSEIGWPTPNMYRAEASFLTSVYGSLQGLDGIFHFALGSEGWDSELGKFPINTPVTLGAFPAAALVFRRGDVQESPPLVMEKLRIEDLYALKGSSATVSAALDQFRATDLPPGQERKGEVQAVDPLTFYAGRTARSFLGNPEDSVQRGTIGLIDRENKRIKSVTGELNLDYGNGIATLNTSNAQGAAGFLGRTEAIQLDHVTLRMKNDYGTLTVVSLDNQPIIHSRKILIQSMTIEQLYGFEATGEKNLDGTIHSVGSAPWGVEKYDVSVTLNLSAAGPVKVIACDEHGYPTDKPVQTSGPPSNLTIRLNESSPYHVVLTPTNDS